MALMPVTSEQLSAVSGGLKVSKLCPGCLETVLKALAESQKVDAGNRDWDAAFEFAREAIESLPLAAPQQLYRIEETSVAQLEAEALAHRGVPDDLDAWARRLAADSVAAGEYESAAPTRQVEMVKEVANGERRFRDVAAPPVEPFTREQCVCAAIQFENGYVIRGHRHNDCLRTAGDIPIDHRPTGIPVQGFMTTHNRFVERVEARELQEAAGVLPKRGGYQHELYSEDIY
jgi:hypothetical protein